MPKLRYRSCFVEHNMSELRHLSVVCVGPSKSGKSTVLGNLLNQLGVDQNGLEEYRVYDKDPNDNSKNLLNYRGLVDRLVSERLDDETKDLSSYTMQTDRYVIQLFNTPGDARYHKNAIRGISMADVCLFVTTFDTPPENVEQRDLLSICQAFGIRYFIVIINKMDLHSSKQMDVVVLEKIKENFVNQCIRVGIQPGFVTVVPSIAKSDEGNIHHASTREF